MSRSQHMIALPTSFVPGPDAVICAKGREAKNHPGNIWLRSLVKAHLMEYSECPSKLERSFVVSKLVKTIRQAASPEGVGFVRKVNGVWYDVGDRNAREKIGQNFRDLLHTEYRSSAKAKAAQRRQLNEASMSSETSSIGTTSVPNKHQHALNNPVCPVTPPHRSLQTIKPFPVTEVLCFNNNNNNNNVVTPTSFCTAPKVFMDVEMTLSDMEPLPLTEALTLDQTFNVSSGSCISMDSTFEEAMDELYNASFTMA